MNLFQNVKYGVSCREAAERYGVSVNRQGKALCPFHNDRNPSLYVADDHFYCFACGAHGDVIDFAANFFDLPLYEAAQRLAADFGIDTDRPPTKKFLEKRRQKTEAQQLTENERLCFSVLSDYVHVLRDWMTRYAPLTQDEPLHERFIEACRNLDQTEYYLDILCAGDSHERAKQRLDAMTANKAGLETIAAKAADSMDAEVEKFCALQEQAKAVDAAELYAARMELRGEMIEAVREKVKDTFGENYDYDRFHQADRDVSELLGEPHPDEQRSVLHNLHHVQEQPAPEKQNCSRKNEQEL